MSHQFHSTVLREYDIRGIIGETLGEADAYAIGRGFATLLGRAGHEVARAIRLASTGRLGPASLARIEHDWGVGVRALVAELAT